MSAVPSKTVKKPVSAFSRVLFGMVLTLTVVGITGFIILVFGHVSGNEFSPDDFDRRRFIYHRVPLIRFQITPVARNKMSNDLEMYLSSNKIVATTGKGGRWDVVRLSSGARIELGDASILCNYLDETADGKHTWLEWSKQHPKIAAVFWPAIQQAARQNAYFFVPKMFDLAVAASDVKDFSAELDKLLTHNYASLADDYQTLGQHKAAIQLYTAALDRDPNNKSALKGRSKSLRELGKTTEAQADDQHAKSIES